MSQPHDSDDEYQIVVEATPPPQRRPRTPNPAVDDVIQSGEIEVPRSLIIRSQSQPAIPVVRDDATEPTISQADMVAAGARPSVGRRLKYAWLLAALAPAVAAIALSFVHASKTTTEPIRTAEAESVAQLIGTMLDGDARAVQVRAEAIASSSMLRAAIQTDASTMADMARDNDIVFPHGAGETIEVFQGGGKAGEHTSLLRLPVNAPTIAAPAPGTARLDHKDGGLVIVVDAPVIGQSNAPAGDLALASPIDMSRIRNRKYEQLTGVMLTGFGAPISLGGGPAVANGQPITAQITTTVFKGQTLAVAAMVAGPSAAEQSDDSLFKGLRLACAGLATLFVIMFGVSLLVRR